MPAAAIDRDCAADYAAACAAEAVNAEQATLKFSIALTVLLGVLGIASGLATGSQAIIFDGMYSFVDVVHQCRWWS